MKFPKEAAKYIALQRLETQKLGKSIHYTTLGKVAYHWFRSIAFAALCGFAKPIARFNIN